MDVKKIVAKELLRLANRLMASDSMEKISGEIEFEIVRYKNSKGDLITEEEFNKLPVEDQKDYSISDIVLNVEYNGQYGDFGIGSYEYWGFKGVHHDWGFELEDITSIKDDQGNDWSEKLTSSEKDKLDQECIEDGENSYQDMQEYYNDMAREEYENDRNNRNYDDGF